MMNKDIPLLDEEGNVIGSVIEVKVDGKVMHGIAAIMGAGIIGGHLSQAIEATLKAEEENAIAKRNGFSFECDMAIEESEREEFNVFVEQMFDYERMRERRAKMIEELKCMELEVYTDHENREQSKGGWYNPRRFGEVMRMGRKSTFSLKARSRTHSQYKYSWKKKKPKKYRA